MKKKNQNRRKKPIKNRKLKTFGRKVSNKLKTFGKKLSNKGHLQFLNSEIIYEPMRDQAYEDLPDSVKKQAEDLHELIFDDPEKAIPILLTLVEEYPHIPQFKNFLSVAYSQMEDNEKAYEIIIETCQQHPDYLFGKTNYASLCIERGEFDKIPEIFDNKMALELLYPDRREFHVSEYTNFNGIMALYHIELDQDEIELDPLEIAYRYYKIVLDLNPDSPLIERIERSFITKLFNPEKLRQGIEEMESEMSEEERKELEELDAMSDEEFEKWELETQSKNEQPKHDKNQQPEHDLELSEFEEFKFKLIKKFFERILSHDEFLKSTQEPPDKSDD